MSQEEEDEGPEQELTEPGGKVRLFVDARLASGVPVELGPDQTHYLLHVMRAKAGDGVRLFNGRDGEWRARIRDVSKRRCMLSCEAKMAAQAEMPDVWLAFAPVKRIPADYITQKATELGARMLLPVITHRTIARRVNLERMRAIAIEAAEQSGRLSVPGIAEPRDLEAVLRDWPEGRTLIFCDEGGDASPIAPALRGEKGSASRWALLTGPEGGFDAGERSLIRAHPATLPVTLGPRIMRADTAALAALAVWQALCGDWNGGLPPVGPAL